MLVKMNGKMRIRRVVRAKTAGSVYPSKGRNRIDKLWKREKAKMQVVYESLIGKVNSDKKF